MVVIAPEYELVMDRPEVAEYVEQSHKRSEPEHAEESRPKEGVFSGLTARHPVTARSCPYGYRTLYYQVMVLAQSWRSLRMMSVITSLPHVMVCLLNR